MCLLTYALLCVSHIVVFHRHRSVSVKWHGCHLCWYSFLSCYSDQFLVIEHLRWSKEYNFTFSICWCCCFWRVCSPKKISVNQKVWRIFITHSWICYNRWLSSETSHVTSNKHRDLFPYNPRLGCFLLSWIRLSFSSAKIWGVLIFEGLSSHHRGF